MLKGRSVICFANDWKGDPLSKKHLMMRLARDNRILWINSLHNRKPRVSKKDALRVWHKLKSFFRGIEKVDANIWTLTPLYIPMLGSAWVRRINQILLRAQIGLALRRCGFSRPITWTFVPSSADVVGTLGEELVIYHCTDEFAAFSDAASEQIRLAEERLLLKSDLVLACSQPLVDRKISVNPNTHLFLHGVDYEHFRRAADAATPVAEEIRTLPRPILGFHGLVADWVNLPLIAEIARLRPEWSIVLVGKVDTGLEALNSLPNVHILGHRPFAQLPAYLRGFDVAILPFTEDDLTYCANPLKLREYLAAGLPVISAPLPAVLQFQPVVRTAHRAEEYIWHVEELVDRGETGPSEERSELMASESWDRKVEEVGDLLASHLKSALGGPARANHNCTATQETTGDLRIRRAMH